MTLAPSRRASLHKGMLRARQWQGTHTTAGILSFHFDHIAQTWEWVTHRTENHDLCIYTEKGMISLGKGKKTREKGKKPQTHKTPKTSHIFALWNSQLMLFTCKVKKSRLWLGLFSVSTWTPRESCQQLCSPCCRHILVTIKQGKAFCVHSSSRGTMCYFT